jgi:DNA ligase D
VSLEEYAQKRKFDRTPEPKPGEHTEPGGSRFFVQRHDATRLHYDFRLEIGGVLKSWAVPKGPSLQPLAKSLAVMVEDHPLEYGNFEGNIPKGNYGAGSVMLWDRGVYELLGTATAEEQIARGDLKFRLHGEKLKGEFALVRMKGRGKDNEWLLIKKRDDEAVPGWDIEDYARSVATGRTQEEIAADLPPPRNAKARSHGKRAKERQQDVKIPPGAVKSDMPRNVAPMLAQLGTNPPTGAGWIYEIKWDGVRTICYISGGQLRLVSRRGLSVDKQYPELAILPHYADAETAILDGEIVALDEQGRSRFELIQPRISVKDPNAIAHMARRSPVTLILFDLIYWNGYDLRDVPLLERKALLKKILKPHDRIRYSEHFETDGAAMLRAAREHQLEGVIAKREDSRYESRRSGAWIKLKVTQQQEFLIAGFTRGERKYFGSLALAYHRDGALEYAGNVGTGFDEKMMETIYRQIEPLITKEPPFAGKPDIPRDVTWVRPEVVCEVKFSEWTRDGRLRAPVFLGLRTDVEPSEVVREVAQNPDTVKASPKHAKPRKAAAKPERRSPLIPLGKNEVTLNVDGRNLKFTNLDKIFYPRDGYTKRDIINYYDAVAHLLVPHLANRPLSLKRYPNGIHEPFFFQKDMPESTPDWVRIELIPSEYRGESIRYVVADDRATLLYLANLGCVDQNPWMSRIGTLEYPDFALIDLDPTEGASFDLIIEAALLVKKQLDQLELEGYPKTTGGDGMHVYIPLEPTYTYEQVRSFAEILFHLVYADAPDLFTTPRTVSKRKKGRVYFDYLQISTGKTIAAPYVIRAYDGAPVATPLEWNEVKRGLRPHDFRMANVLDRFERMGDLFRGVLDRPQKLEPVLKRLGEIMKT